ncbi:sirohydrochlorin ferrochelatase, chloroplastic-like isoform X1 [Zingiber officinale]|uniref:sirohydrochlorin ferrochelatase, chloroplastic-like isoform X1 n=2 Tax=Zingiber officinale TaxID=94328 RepID=UPI001C4DA72D|nr:sirohydrochlorin ferrochelatase, chloroplastic-like isoform X1 [Zingiber officinale]XP_042452936.1 sirohydrochlorin ferrochelatase, chloroplastic-like isoform X1 [Zingiber officinale]XP_042452937.1 sirohydrochlorin ferrochelatase, chloroplastic-like isoform X1 [Zingiber officinale]
MMQSAKTLSQALITRGTSSRRERVRILESQITTKFVSLPRTMSKSCALSTKSDLNHRNKVAGRVEYMLSENDAVIIVDHGSRRQESNDMLNEFVAMFKARTGYQIVEPAHMKRFIDVKLSSLLMQEKQEIVDSCCFHFTKPTHYLYLLSELAEPSISDAFKLCVQKGATRVIVSPFFLFPGRHWLQDIPALVTDASKYHSGISFVITAPLGLHELMVDVMNDRIKYCLSHVAGDADECSVCAGTGKCRLYQT